MRAPYHLTLPWDVLTMCRVPQLKKVPARGVEGKGQSSSKHPKIVHGEYTILCLSPITNHYASHLRLGEV